MTLTLVRCCVADYADSCGCPACDAALNGLIWLCCLCGSTLCLRVAWFAAFSRGDCTCGYGWLPTAARTTYRAFCANTARARATLCQFLCRALWIAHAPACPLCVSHLPPPATHIKSTRRLFFCHYSLLLPVLPPHLTLCHLTATSHHVLPLPPSQHACARCRTNNLLSPYSCRLDTPAYAYHLLSAPPRLYRAKLPRRYLDSPADLSHCLSHTAPLDLSAALLPLRTRCRTNAHLSHRLTMTAGSPALCLAPAACLPMPASCCYLPAVLPLHLHCLPACYSPA